MQPEINKDAVALGHEGRSILCAIGRRDSKLGGFGNSEYRRRKTKERIYAK
jgi:hypothetical protein